MHQPMWPLALLLATFPLGVAAQNCGTAVVGGWLLWQLRHPSIRSRLRSVPKLLWAQLVLSAVFILWLITASWLNPSHPNPPGLDYLMGHLPWILLPWLGYAVFQPISESTAKKLFTILMYIAMAWSIVALSQAIWGWRMSGSSFTGDVLRPRGFYSHPLSFAYAVLWLWPLAVVSWLRDLRSPLKLLFLLAVAVMIYLTESRTVQVVAAMVILGNIFYLLKGRAKALALAISLLTAMGIALTENKVSDKFRQTFSSEGMDRKSDYPDDRLAFWDAHRLMVWERPLLGHGVHLNGAYRRPYYDALGLTGFSKRYEAHNTFLQMTAEGGVIALIIFTAWLATTFTIVGRLRKPTFQFIAAQTLAAFLIAALSQNAFQDSEVRMGLVIFMCALWWI